MKHPGRTLVFVNAVSATRRLAALLSHLGVKATALHASQQQRQRLKVELVLRMLLALSALSGNVHRHLRRLTALLGHLA